MTTMVAVYVTAGAPRAMAVDVGTGGDHAEVWNAVAGALPEGDELIAIVEGARGTDAFCMVGSGTYVTLAPPAPVSYEAHEAETNNDAGLTTKPAKKTKGA